MIHTVLNVVDLRYPSLVTTESFVNNLFSKSVSKIEKGHIGTTYIYYPLGRGQTLDQ